MTAARNRFANIAMPLGGLGLLQDAIVQLAGILGQPVPDISRRAAVVFCADNGVVAEGVTQCGQEVTATVAENMGRGESTVCLMAKQLGMDVFPGRYWCCAADKERKSAAIFRSARNCKLCA